MKLDDLWASFDRYGFPAADEHEHPDKDSVLAARSAVTAAMSDDEFLIDCLPYELSLIESGIPRRGLVPFFTVPALGIRFAFGYWAPGRNVGPHEHTAWTITGVCRNELVVQTYDRDESYRRQQLVPKNCFSAAAGKVGFIYDPCIHDPHNPTDRWSLSLHVSSPRDGEKLSDHEECPPLVDGVAARQSRGYGDAYDDLIATRSRQLIIRAIAGFLIKMDDRAAAELVSRCAQQGSVATRRFIGRLGGTDPHDVDLRSARTVVRRHHDLALDYREVDDRVVLGIQTSGGWVDELTIARDARDAIKFCTRTTQFDVPELPGRLTDEERWKIAEALEETGLFAFAPLPY
jgi:hypothetical protein